ncbi:MAG: hypothetical protein QM756_45680 [Polyangiaceae bacterium]
MRVVTMTTAQGALKVEYRILAVTIRTICQELIAQTVLLKLCEDRYRGKVEQVEFVHLSHKKSTTIPYAAAVHP